MVSSSLLCIPERTTSPPVDSYNLPSRDVEMIPGREGSVKSTSSRGVKRKPDIEQLPRDMPHNDAKRDQQGRDSYPVDRRQHSQHDVRPQPPRGPAGNTMTPASLIDAIIAHQISRIPDRVTPSQTSAVVPAASPGSRGEYTAHHVSCLGHK